MRLKKINKTNARLTCVRQFRLPAGRPRVPSMENPRAVEERSHTRLFPKLFFLYLGSKYRSDFFFFLKS